MAVAAIIAAPAFFGASAEPVSTASVGPLDPHGPSQGLTRDVYGRRIVHGAERTDPDHRDMNDNVGMSARVYVLVLLAAAVGTLAGAPALAAGDGGKDDDASRGQVGSAARARALVFASVHRGNVIRLAQTFLDLSDEQSRQLDALRQKQERERARFLVRQGRLYSGRIREMLTERQKVQYDDVLAAVEELEGELADARKEFLEVAGVEAGKEGAAAEDRIDTADLTRYLGLPEATTRQIRQLKREMYKCINEALEDAEAAEGRHQDQAPDERIKRYREVHRVMRERFEAQRDALLAPEQLKKLRLLEGAAEQYRSRVEKAYKDAARRASELLEKAGEK